MFNIFFYNQFLIEQNSDKAFSHKNLEMNQGKNQMTNNPQLIVYKTHFVIPPPQQESDKTSLKSIQKGRSNLTGNQDKKLGFTEYAPSDSESSKQSLYQDDSSEKNSSDNKLFILRKRKNKRQKMSQIKQNHSDNGRGGNCVASNICKTLLRIIIALLTEKVKLDFAKMCEIFEIRSQKENTIIIILILLIMVKKGTLKMEVYQKMMKQFFQSLKESEENCLKKMSQESQRKSFHLKNKRMYNRFAQINRELYQRSVQNIKQNETFDLKQLQEIISETYDRKQREVQKAMGKIKSIILKHEELKEFFNYHEIDIEQAFFESIDYAYRRNLPKRCRQVKQRARLIISRFKSNHFTLSENEIYMVCYMTLKLIDEKEKEIWSEFLTNLTMKKKFNQTQQELERFKNLLQKDIPSEFQQFTQTHKTINTYKKEKEFFEHQMKMEQETNLKSTHVSLFSIYNELKETFQF